MAWSEAARQAAARARKAALNKIHKEYRILFRSDPSKLPAYSGTMTSPSARKMLAGYLRQSRNVGPARPRLNDYLKQTRDVGPEMMRPTVSLVPQHAAASTMFRNLKGRH